MGDLEGVLVGFDGYSVGAMVGSGAMHDRDKD